MSSSEPISKKDNIKDHLQFVAFWGATIVWCGTIVGILAINAIRREIKDSFSKSKKAPKK